jgi:hypothetical protein
LTRNDQGARDGTRYLEGETMDTEQFLVECRDHKLAPGVVVCRHLLNGQSREWCPVGGESPECYDWLCPECGKDFPDIGVEDLHTVCVHCIRALQQTATVIHELPDAE